VVKKEKISKETFELQNGEVILSSSSDSSLQEESVTFTNMFDSSPQQMCMSIIDQLIDLVVDSFQDALFEEDSPVKQRVSTENGRPMSFPTKIKVDRVMSTQLVRKKIFIKNRQESSLNTNISTNVSTGPVKSALTEFLADEEENE
jgi:hypothetical protein